jgi:hypothetical protein
MSIPMSMYLEMGVVRESGASLNRSGVECGIRKVKCAMACAVRCFKVELH